MARPTLFTHRKFLKLSRLLRSDVLALGHLEFMWHAANESGDPVLGDQDDAEAVARWQGESGELVQALVSSGFVDRRPDGVFEIHDYWHHCPDYVRKRAFREAKRRERGPVNDRTVTGQTPDNDRTPTGRGTTNPGSASRTPAPTPAPAPTPLSTPDRESVSDRGVAPAHDKRAARAAPVLIPDDWQPNEANRRWLTEAGLSREQQADVIREFVLWARNSERRQKDWNLAFSRNPHVKSAIGRVKANGAKGAEESAEKNRRRVRELAKLMHIEQGADDYQRFEARVLAANERRLKGIGRS